MIEKRSITKHELISFYKAQLRKFFFLGMGNKTENRVIITPTLISATKRRLKQLRGIVGQSI